MTRRIRHRNCPCPSSAIPPDGEAGYVFLILLLAVTLLLIALTAALPSVYTAGQREREKETIFRGNQYARAILEFRQRFGRFPISIDELVKPTNGMRFLRQAYTDPLDRKGVWRYIHADANGVLVDSLTAGPPKASAVQGNNNQSSPLQGLGSLDQDNPDQNQQDQNEQSDQNDQNQGGVFSNQPVGAFIAGVAPTSKAASIIIYNKHDHYNMWEFIGVQAAANGGGGIPQMNPGAQPGPGGAPIIPTMPPLTAPPSSQ